MELAEKKRVGDSIGRLAPEGCYTRARAAELVGRSPDTLSEWQRTGKYLPSRWRMHGKTRVWFYTDEDIKAMKLLAQTLRPGRPPSGDN